MLDPAAPTTLYAGSESGGVFKSTNGGGTWRSVSPASAGQAELRIKALAISGTAPATLFAATMAGMAWSADVGTMDGVVKSADGRTTSTSADGNLAIGHPVALVADPRTAGTLYAAMSRAGVYKTTNGTTNGGTWTRASTGLPSDPVVGLAIDPAAPATLYAATDQSGIYKSTDGAATWRPVNGGLLATSTRSVVIDPRSPAILYAGTAEGGLYKSANGGTSWAPANGGIPDGIAYLRALAVDPATPSTLYAASDRPGAFKSTDGGSTWRTLAAGLADTVVNIMAIDPQDPSTLYAGTTRGVFKSTDGGASWRGANSGLVATNVRHVAAGPSASQPVYAGLPNGVVRTVGGTPTWGATVGLPNDWILALAVDPVTPSTLYAVTNAHGLQKSTNSGDSWAAINNGLPQSRIKGIAVNPVTPGTLYLAMGTDGVYKSTDSGANWSAFNSPAFGAADVSVISVASHPNTQDGDVFALTDQGRVFSSPNFRPGWLPMGTELPASPIASLVVVPTGFFDLYAVVPNELSDSGGLYKWFSASGTWIDVTTGLPNAPIYNVAIDPERSDTLYAITGEGVYQNDRGGGGPWARLEAGLPNTTIRSIAVRGGIPYAGSFGRGVLAFGAPVQPDQTLTVSVTGSGTVTATGINCGTDCSEAYPLGTSVTLTATPSSGATFTGWSNGPCSGVATTCTVTMDGAKAVTASFSGVAPSTYTLSVTVTGQGTVTATGISCGADCQEPYAAGAPVTLTATPGQGANISTFAGWGGGCVSAGTSPTCTLTMTKNEAVTATFARVNAGVVVSPLPNRLPNGDRVLSATLTARQGCGPITSLQFGEAGRPLDNARVSITSPTGGPASQTAGFTYTPPAGTTSVTFTIQRVAQSAGATVNPIRFADGCGEWRTLVGGGLEAFR